MVDDFNKVLDECIDRVNRGEGWESCLTDYPEYAQRLKPLLLAVKQTQSAYAFTPSEDAKRAGRQRLYTALEKKRRPSLWQQILSHRGIWATTASIIVIGIAVYLGLRATVLSPEPPGGYIVQPSPGTVVQPGSDYIAAANVNGNFSFLVSDEVNAIADFSAVNVTVSRIGILQSGESGRWQEFTPEIKEFDLSLLPGDKTQELWRGNVPEGEYQKAFIYIDKITGVLKSTGETIDIKLPGNKLQMSLPFRVDAANVTCFTYDLTVVDTGNGKNEKYLVKPQVSQSGASQKPLPKYGPENDNNATVPPDILNPSSVINNRKK
jgi:hypothetical protein